MGNKLNTRRRMGSDSNDDVSRRRRRKPTRSQSASQVDGRANRISMPELGGAVPYSPDDESDINIKVYRSYGDLARPKATTLDRSEYKVYRKSTEGLQKYASLPRHFGRSKSAMDVPNGTLRDDVRRKRELPYSPDYPEIMPRRRSPPESVSSHSSLRGESQRTSKRVSAASSVSSLAKAPVTQDDFPSTEQVKKKLACFEEQFCRSLADKYAGLADTLQLSALSIALARGQDGQYRHVKLLDYLEGEAVPLDLHKEDPDKYIMLMPDALFHGIMHVRRDKISDLELWTTLARDLVTCVAMEAGNELTRIFEYQIGLLTGDSAVRVLADHAAACVIEYVKRYSSVLDRNTAIVGVIRGYPDQTMAGTPKYLSVILGNRELKWELQDVFKRPGLRRELLLFGSAASDADDLYAPWRYYTSKDCDPQLFGYRGLLLEWDWIKRSYRVNDRDTASFTEDISEPASYPDDFHRLYSPYKVLFGEEVMAHYSELKVRGKSDVSLAEFVRDLTGGERDEVQPVYRPLVAPSAGVDFHTMNLDNVDLTRAQLTRANLSQAKLNHAKLLLANLDGAQFDEVVDGRSVALRGTDVSYTNLVPSTLDQASLEGITARHVVVATRKPAKKQAKGRRPKDGIARDDPGSDAVAVQLVDQETTPVTSNVAKKKRKVPKTLNIQKETNGHTETMIDDPADYPDSSTKDPSVDQDPQTLDTCCVSDSRGNLMNIEQVIEQKQKKIRERKKKTKKRPVSPIASTPTEPIPEATVFVQEQVAPQLSSIQNAQHFAEEPRRRSPRQRPPDPTEEFFKESQPQYQRPACQPSGANHALDNHLAREADPDAERPGGGGDTGKRQSAAGAVQVTESGGDRDATVAEVSDQNAAQEGSRQVEAVDQSKSKKKGKKAAKAKADQSKAGDKKRKKSRNKTPEKEAASTAETAPESRQKEPFQANGPPPDRPSSATPSKFPAIDPAHLVQKSPGKALSTTDINQQQHPADLRDPATSRGDGSLRPRMTKSLSHHGNLTTEGTKLHNLSLDSYALGLRTARQIYGVSKEEVEYITRSQIFDMIKGLQVENIQSNLPDIDDKFIGRERECDDVTDLLSAPGRIVTVTGCYGNGKSALATAVGHEAYKKFVVPIVVDVRGCLTTDSVVRRLTSTFGLQFGHKELTYFYNWLNCHEQRLLFIVDNLDVGAEEDCRLSDLLDGIVMFVKDARVLCLCRRNFFRGSSTHEVYRLGGARGFSLNLIHGLLPDLHEEGMEGLLEACAHNPLILHLIAKTFFAEDVDPGKLFEELVKCDDHPLLDRVEASLDGVVYDEGERETLRKLACSVLILLDNIPLEYAELIQKASHSPASFDAETVAVLAERSDVDAVKQSLDELKKLGFVIGAAEDRYYLPSLIRLVSQCKLSDNGTETMEYCKTTLENIEALCAKYHSKECERAISDFRDDFDRYVDVIGKVIQREDTYERCPDFASLEYALFLGELLPEEVYLNFYESFAQEAENRGDVAKECRALCCLSHRLLAEESIGASKHAVDRAYELVHTLVDMKSEQAFCLRCMGLIVWQEADDRNRALMLVKRSLDLYKEAGGSRDLQTIHTNELYARMLTHQERYQTARHFYNISDLFVTEAMNGHPLLIEGYDCRRIIWDGLCLFQRATDMAKKAAEVSRIFFGEHPTTARMMSNLCDAIIKRGCLTDAIRAGIDALSIRSKVLGDHRETGESYKKLAYLMLRSGQYDEAVRFGQSALEVFDKVGAPEMLKIDVKNVMAQARLRLDYKSHVYIELQGRDASKKNLHSESEEVNASPTQPVMSTEV